MHISCRQPRAGREQSSARADSEQLPQKSKPMAELSGFQRAWRARNLLQKWVSGRGGAWLLCPGFSKDLWPLSILFRKPLNTVAGPQQLARQLSTEEKRALARPLELRKWPSWAYGTARWGAGSGRVQWL